MDTPRDAKLAFHRELTCAAVARGTNFDPDTFETVLAQGYAEIDHLFSEGRPRGGVPINTGLVWTESERLANVRNRAESFSGNIW